MNTVKNIFALSFNFYSVGTFSLQNICFLGTKYIYSNINSVDSH